MKLDLNNLREKCAAATPGGWFYGGWSGQCHINHSHSGGNCKYDKYKSDGTNMCSENGFTIFVTSDEYGKMEKRDGEFIAAFNPSTCAELLRRIEVMEGALRYYASHGKGRHDCPTCDGGDLADEALQECE